MNCKNHKGVFSEQVIEPVKMVFYNFFNLE
jgi:hypothetical protein